MRIPICCNRRNEGVPRYIEGENALGGEIIRDLLYDPSLRKKAADSAH